MLRMKRGRKKECERRERCSKARPSLVKSGKWLFSPFASGAELAMCQCFSRRTAEEDGGDGKDAAGRQVKEGRWAEEIPQMWRPPKGEDMTEKKKQVRAVRCALLNGSAWSTEKKYMRKYKRKSDIFVGMEHRMRKEEMEEQFNKDAKDGWKFAADAATITYQRAGSEDRKHTSGGVFVAVDSNLGAVVGA